MVCESECVTGVGVGGERTEGPLKEWCGSAVASDAVGSPILLEFL